MSQANSFWEHPIEKLEEALQIRKQIGVLQDKLKGLFASAVEISAAVTAPGRKKRKRTMSPEARAKIAAAQRARWAKSKGTKASTAVAGKVKSATKKAKRNISPEARAKMAAAAKRRWAKVRKAA